MKTSPIIVFYLFVLLATMSCSAPDYSPWQTDLPKDQQNLTAKHLSALDLQEQKLPFTIAVIGDPQGYPGELNKAIKKINQHDIAFTMVLGDITDYGIKGEYQRALEPLLKLEKPFLTVIGNHDSLAHGKDIYRKMFGAFDYTFHYAGVKFVMWNNNAYEFGNAVNVDWMAHEISSKKAVIASHVTPADEDTLTPELSSRWQALNNEHEVSISLSAHSHQTSSWEDNGTQYYVVADVKRGNYSLITFDKGFPVEQEFVSDDTYQVSKIETCKESCSEEN